MYQSPTTHLIHEHATVIRCSFEREKINGEGRVRGAISGRHALRRPKISRVDGTHEALIQIHSYRHLPAFACRRNRRLKLGIQ